MNNTPKIAIITNEYAAGRRLQYLLEKEHYDASVVAAQPGKKISFKNDKPDLILLDIDKPKKYRAAISSIGDIPVIIICKNSKFDDTLNLLENGAVDFLEKPFKQDELLSIVRAYLCGEPPSYWPAEILPGEMVLDRLKRLAVIDGKQVKLTPVELEILLLMYGSPRVIVIYDVFKSNIAKLTKKTSKKAIDSHIKVISEKLEKIGFDGRIEKEEGAGYSLQGEGAGNRMVEMVGSLFADLLGIETGARATPINKENYG